MNKKLKLLAALITISAAGLLSNRRQAWPPTPPPLRHRPWRAQGQEWGKEWAQAWGRE